MLCPKRLNRHPPTSFLKFGGFFMFFFSGSNPSAHAMQNLYIHSISGIGRKPVKKNPCFHATLLLTMKPEVESPLNRICISYNRRGHSAFAVFLLSFFIRLCHRAVSAVGCRSPPSQSGFFTFSKIQIGGNKEWHITTDVRTGNGVSGKKPRKSAA